MKKLLLFLLAIALCIPLLSACAGIGDGSPETTKKPEAQDRFDFSYEIENTSYLRGETFSINASVKNISGEDMTYTAVMDSYYPEIELYCMSEDGNIAASLKYEPFETVSGFGEMIVKEGQIGSKLYTFVIPHDAPLGTYAVRLSYRGESCEFRDVLMILDNTSQNENDKYRNQYSPISVSAGGESVNPIRVGTSTHIQYADGTFAIGCDGLGVWMYFGKEATDLSTFPLLVLEDEPKLTLPENTGLEGVCIYDLNCNQIGGYYASIKALEALPAGEYVVVLKTVYDTRAISQTEYEITNYDDFFRLSIPQDTEINEFEYSPIRISSGGVEILPIREYLYSSYHKDGEGYEADGFGVWSLFNDEAFSQDDIPALTFKGSVHSSCPAGVTIENVTIYDTAYNKIPFDMEFLWDFSKLPDGDYIVVIHEKDEFDEYTTYGYESVFRLIVPEQDLTESGYETTVKMLQYAWSGAGVSSKTISTCDIAYLIIDALAAMPETGETVEKISDDSIDGYLYESPVPRGTVWLEIGSKIYRIDPNFTELCRVETHLGAGVVLDASGNVFKMIYDALHYYPYDFYTGTYNNNTGEIELNNVFEADSTVEVNVKKLKVEKEFNSVNTITIELISSVDQKISIRLDSAQSDDNLAAGDYKEIELTKGKAEALELSFGGWSYSYWITITVDNTRINLMIEP